MEALKAFVREWKFSCLVSETAKMLHAPAKSKSVITSTKFSHAERHADAILKMRGEDFLSQVPELADGDAHCAEHPAAIDYDTPATSPEN